MAIGATKRIVRLRQVSWCVLALASFAAVPNAALAQDAPVSSEVRIAFDIPAQPLGDALRRFAERTGIQLGYSTELVAGRQSAAVRGTMTSREALAQLLVGTGISGQFIDARTVSLELLPDADGARVLGAVRIQGMQGEGGGYGPLTRGDGIAQLGGVRGRQDDEAVGYRARVATAGGGVPTAIEDIPRSISVLTQDQIEDQDIFDFRDALKRLPGVTFRETTAQQAGNATITSRGYPVNTVQIDGGPAQRLSLYGNGTLDLAAYERVELVRGPNGVFAGADIGPGGTLNLVRKRPSDRETLQLQLTAGSFERRQVQADYSVPSILGSNIAFRGIVSWQDTEFFYWNADKKNLLIYGIFDMPLGESARFEIGGKYTEVDETATYFGVGRYIEGPAWDVPYEFNASNDLTYNKGYDKELFARIHMDLADQWDFQLGISRNWGFYDKAFYGSYYGNFQPDMVQATGLTVGLTLGDTSPSGIGLRADQDSLGGLQADLRINGQFSTWLFEHSLFLSAEYSEAYTSSGEEKPLFAVKLIRTLADWYPDNPYITVNEYLALIGEEPIPGLDDIYYTRTDRDYATSNVSMGFTVQDVISVSDWLDLNVQLRWFASRSASAGTSYDILTEEQTFASYNSSETVSKIRPTYGITLKPLDRLRIFASYSEGFNDQSQLYDIDHNPLDPATYQNWEAGLKWASDTWYAALTAYDLRLSNSAEAVEEGVPGARECPPTGQSACYYREGAIQTSRGIDFEVAGEVLPGLQLLASYNYNENETISSSLPISTVSPAHTAKLWVDWTPSFLPQLSLRAGADYRSRIYETGQRYVVERIEGTNEYRQIYVGPFEIDEPAATVFEAGASYDFNDRLRLDVLVENLTDKRYFATKYSLAAPRTVTATLRLKTGASELYSPPGELTVFGKAADWYAGVQTGIHFPSDIELTGGVFPGGERVKWTGETDGQAAALLSLGYRIAPNWRGELEIGLRKGSVGSVLGGTRPPTGVCSTETDAPAAPDCGDAGGDVDATTFMANIVYDLGDTDSRLRPFVGAGVGLVSLSVDFGGRLQGVEGDPQFGSQTQTANFGWQLMAGIGWHISERLTLDAIYRYLSVPSATLDGFVLPEYQAGVGSFDTSFNDSTATIGFRWAFGGRN